MKIEYNQRLVGVRFVPFIDNFVGYSPFNKKGWIGAPAHFKKTAVLGVYCNILNSPVFCMSHIKQAQ